MDEFLIPGQSSLPYIINEGGLLVFDLGELGYFENGTVELTVEVSCEATLSQTHCSQANIYPDDYCSELYDEWFGNIIKNSVTCLNDDSLQFRILNQEEEMPSSEYYRIYRDNILIEEEPFILGVDEELKIIKHADRATYRIETSVSENSPQGISSASMEACGVGENGLISFGIINDQSLGDLDPFIDIECTQNVGAFDPNDIQVVPAGIGESNCISLDIELGYL